MTSLSGSGYSFTHSWGQVEADIPKVGTSFGSFWLDDSAGSKISYLLTLTNTSTTGTIITLNPRHGDTRIARLRIDLWLGRRGDCIGKVDILSESTHGMM